MSRVPWFAAPVCERLLQQARDLEREALRFRALAHKVQSPPEGVTVEYDWCDTLRFVGPAVTANSQSEPSA